MKKLMLAILCCGLITGFAFAQDQKEMKQDHKDWDKKVKTELNLTTEQESTYDAVCKEFDEKMEAVKKDATLSPESQREKKKELKKEKQARLFEFFTPEQQTKYLEMMEKKKVSKQPGS